MKTFQEYLTESADSNKTKVVNALKDVKGVEVVGSGYKWEVRVVGTEKVEPSEQRDHMKPINAKVTKALKAAGIAFTSTMSGFGGLIAKPGATVKGDANDKSSKHHY